MKAVMPDSRPTCLLYECQPTRRIWSLLSINLLNQTCKLNLPGYSIAMTAATTIRSTSTSVYDSIQFVWTYLCKINPTARKRSWCCKCSGNSWKKFALALVKVVSTRVVSRARVGSAPCVWGRRALESVWLWLAAECGSPAGAARRLRPRRGWGRRAPRLSRALFTHAAAAGVQCNCVRARGRGEGQTRRADELQRAEEGARRCVRECARACYERATSVCVANARYQTTT